LPFQELPYDYAFIGMGCANSLILLELDRAGLLAQKRILVYEPEQKKGNDRTFCFWLEPNVLQEAGLNQLVSHSWSKVKCNEEAPQLLAGKRYYYLRADALYAHTTQLLSQYDVPLLPEVLHDYPKSLAHFVFDSRPPQFDLNHQIDVQISQSFYGWLVETEVPIFDPEVFTMMDFSIPQNGHTQFLYVLPFDTRQALIEPTRFGEVLISEQEATQVIEKFLEERNTPFQILEKEQGCIPMCSASLQNEALPNNWFRTGAGGGQLKPSTGYSFVRSLTDAQQIVKSLSLNEAKFNRRKSPQRFAYYDRLLLKIIAQKPEKGKVIFTKLFHHTAAAKVLNFLDEKSTPFQELRLMSTLPILLFLNAALFDAIGKFRGFLAKRSVALYMTITLLVFQQFQLGLLSNLILIVGLLSIGLPHGALDHLHQYPGKKLSQLLPYFTLYIALGLGVLCFWLLAPPLALILFLVYSAWHFGQADLEIWKLKHTFLAPFLWGAYCLIFLLATHHLELITLLQQMGVELYLNWSATLISTFTTPLFWLILGAVPVFLFRSWRIMEAIVILTMLSTLPLIEAFGIYFIFQHSWNGWRYLTQITPLQPKQLWWRALPFTLASIGLFAAYYYWSAAQNWGLLFIFLSALSFPHVFFMHRAYQTRS
jgi:lycopene beta-cyclase